MTTIIITLYILAAIGVFLFHLFVAMLGNGLRKNEFIIAVLTTIFWPLTVIWLIGRAIILYIEFKRNQRI